MTYIVTNSGKQVSPLDGCPSIMDVALGLSRMPRFAGQGRRWWSVLDHSLYIERLARRYFPENVSEGTVVAFRLCCLMHDAHEAMTGDVPTPFKGTQLRDLQWILDARLLDDLCPEIRDYDFSGAGKILDRRALLVEAYKVGPPHLYMIDHVVRHFEEAPNEQDIRIFARGMAEGHFGWSPMELQFGARHCGVRQFLTLYDSLRKDAQRID